MRHLHQMSLHSERTGMTSKNLAIVWSPNILRCDVSELDTQDALQVLDLVLGLLLPSSIYLSLFEAGVDDHTCYINVLNIQRLFHSKICVDILREV